jgi:hypothetical protein
MKNINWLFVLGLLSLSIAFNSLPVNKTDAAKSRVLKELYIKEDKASGTISVFRVGSNEPLLIQNAKADFRPFLHPITAPDGKGVLTEYSPGHHNHQTGLYWGFTRVNGRDFFHNPGAGYWRRVAANVVEPKGKEVKWQTIYDLLNDEGASILTETQNWSMHEEGGKFLI